ncbi:MAG: COG1361 S-layer family protein [Haloferacaceae archaeon]
MSRRLVILALVLVLVVPAPVVASASGQPVLHVALSDRTVGVGQTTALSLTVANEGELSSGSLLNPASDQRVTTARAVDVRLRTGDAPLSVETGPRLLGSLPQGGAAQVPFQVTVDEDATPGTYRLPVRIEYTYTEFVSDRTGYVEETTETLRTHVTVEVTDRAEFRVVSTSADVRAGERGQLSVTMENVGTQAADEASVQVTSLNGGLLFGQAGLPNASQFAGSWNPGERRTLTYRVLAADTERQRNYTIATQVTYLNDDGDPRASRRLAFGVTPTPAPTFALEDVSATLRVGDRGSISGSVVNTGETAVNDAVVVMEPPSQTLRPRQVEYPVGTLEPGERADFSFEVDATEAATAGDEQFSFRVRYEAGEATPRTSDPLLATASVGEEREPFRVEPVNATFPPDTDGNRFVVRVTNVGETPRSDVVVSLAPRPPLTSMSPSAYVGDLAPGESVDVAFSVSVDQDAVESRVPVPVNVTSDTPNRKNAIDGPYLVPVEVREPAGATGDVSLLAAAAVVALMVLIAGWWWLRG